MEDAKKVRTLHVQLEEKIRERILNEWAPGSMIPSENELSREYGVSRMTARSVITKMVGAGLLYRLAGKGTFVAEPKIVTKGYSYACIREQLEQQGYEISTRVYQAEEILPSRKVAEVLELAEGENVYEIHKVRYVQKEPMSIHISYFPVRICKGLLSEDFAEEKLCQILYEKYGIVKGRVREKLESSVATFAEAELLGILPGHPLLLLWNNMYTPDGVPYEFTKVLFRGDRIQLTFDYD